MTLCNIQPTLSDAVDLAARKQWRTALISMPFVSALRPSIQLGLLKAIGEQHGFSVNALHLNLDFCSRIGLGAYEALCQHRGVLLGDWLFAAQAFGNELDSGASLLDDFGDDIARIVEPLGLRRRDLERIRDQIVPAFIDGLVSGIDWSSYSVVGFSCTFQQNTASFALASRLKAVCPHLITVFGGANFAGEMAVEFVQKLGFIDYAVSGEGDAAFPALLHSLMRDQLPRNIPNVVFRHEGSVVSGPESGFADMERLPVPDYREYFEQCATNAILPETERRTVAIPYESSRGCWWGAKNHCTFCGLNGDTMAFRAKSADRIIKDLAVLASRHRSFRFEFVDNILDQSAFSALLPGLANGGADYEFFFELKSNLRREHLRLLRSAGTVRIQPGIESLSSHVLALMRKGVTGIQNVNALRWATYYGIAVQWNLLWGFAGETEEDYRDQLPILEKINHLQPPLSAGRIWIERFSPIFRDPSLGVSNIRPSASYKYVYPASMNRERLAYFFDGDVEGQLPDSVYEPTALAVRRWQEQWEKRPRPGLKFFSAPDLVVVEDSRLPRGMTTTVLRGCDAALYSGCSDLPMKLGALKEQLGLTVADQEIVERLEDMSGRGLIMKESNRYLSLALPATGMR